MLELVLLYCIAGIAAWLMDSRAGQVHPQCWEFFAVTVCLFLVFASPGFVYRFFWRRPGI